ncbi:MAG: hypothetical protein AAF928_08535 [Myxococcota bacterium]
MLSTPVLAPFALPRRRRWILAAALVGGLALGYRECIAFPPDTTPSGAYLRIAAAIGRGAPEACFAYLEEDAQHACFTIANYAEDARRIITESYPDEAKDRALAPYAPFAGVAGGAPTWVVLAEARGWLRRLRRDLSGIAAVDIEDDRASVTTSRSTRYPFRRRANGIWGLTIFTGELVAEVDKLARDAELIAAAAADYRRGG